MADHAFYVAKQKGTKPGWYYGRPGGHKVGPYESKAAAEIGGPAGLAEEGKAN